MKREGWEKAPSGARQPRASPDTGETGESRSAPVSAPDPTAGSASAPS
jgi:hypothetical protein